MRAIYIPSNKQGRRIVSNPLFKLTKEESDANKKPIHLSLRRMAEGTHTGTDWFNVMFRLYVGVFLINKYYTKETSDEFGAVVNVCEEIEKRAKLVDHTVWSITKEEVESLVSGVEAVDALQDSHLRLEVLAAHRYAKDVSSKLCRVKRSANK